MVIMAVHLELVSDLNISVFIIVFISRLFMFKKMSFENGNNIDRTASRVTVVHE